MAASIQIGENGYKLVDTGSGLVVQSSAGVIVGRLDGNGIITAAEGVFTAVAALNSNIPSWAKRITINLNDLATSDTGIPMVRLTSTAVETSGYKGTVGNIVAAGVNFYSLAGLGFVLADSYAANVKMSGRITLEKVYTLSGNQIWAIESRVARSDGTVTTWMTQGSKTLTGVLTGVQLAILGSGTFAGGSYSINYE
jgi:hypothetical protein